MFKIIRTIALLIVATALPLGSQAPAQDDTAAIRQAANNVSHEYVICSVYYRIATQCLRNRGDSEGLATRYEKVANEALDRSFKFGEAAGIMSETIVARMKLAVEDQGAAINKDCVNVAILNAKYGERCVRLMENPDAAFQAYLEQAQ